MNFFKYFSNITSSSFIFSASSIWRHLNRKNRLKVIFLINIFILNGIAELFSLSMVIPLLTIFSNPKELFKYEFFKKLANILEIYSPESFVLPITLIFISAVIFAGCIRVFSLWATNKTYASIGSDLSKSVFNKTLCKPYEIHLEENSSILISTLAFNMEQVVGTLNQIFRFFYSLILIFFLSLTIIVVDWQITFSALFCFSFTYVLAAILTKDLIRKNGQIIVYENQRKIKTLQEGIGGIREIILQQSQNVFTNMFGKFDSNYRSKSAINLFLASFPRYCLESIGIIIISIMGYLILIRDGNITAVITKLGTLALASQKILPALQQIYASWSTFRSRRPALEKIVNILDKDYSNYESKSNLSSITFSEKIEGKNINFKYNPELPAVLENVNFTILKGQKIGIIGETGCGKSTFADILMGLLKPTSGDIIVDGVKIYEHKISGMRFSWMKSISHVPQDLFLIDASIAANIAFPLPKETINKQKIKIAAQKACISEFIESLPNGYDTYVGERGLKLSGGQKQRIGIARAFYRESEIIFLDEATSALDYETEGKVLNSIAKLNENITLIIIAHRLKSLEKCDLIFQIKSKRIELVKPEII